MRKAEASEAAKILNERRFERLSPERREDIAREAAVARWAQERERRGEVKKESATK